MDLPQGWQLAGGVGGVSPPLGVKGKRREQVLGPRESGSWGDRLSSSEETATASPWPGRDRADKYPNPSALCPYSSHWSDLIGSQRARGVVQASLPGQGGGRSQTGSTGARWGQGTVGGLPSSCSWLWEFFHFTASWSRWLSWLPADLPCRVFSSAHLSLNPDSESATLLKGSSCHVAQCREGEAVCVLSVG